MKRKLFALSAIALLSSTLAHADKPSRGGFPDSISLEDLKTTIGSSRLVTIRDNSNPNEKSAIVDSAEAPFPGYWVKGMNAIGVVEKLCQSRGLQTNALGFACATN